MREVRGCDRERWDIALNEAKESETIMKVLLREVIE